MEAGKGKLIKDRLLFHFELSVVLGVISSVLFITLTPTYSNKPIFHEQYQILCFFFSFKEKCLYFS